MTHLIRFIPFILLAFNEVGSQNPMLSSPKKEEEADVV